MKVGARVVPTRSFYSRSKRLRIEDNLRSATNYPLGALRFLFCGRELFCYICRPMTDEFEGQAPLPKDKADSWFGPWRFALILFLLLFVAYPEVFSGQSTFFYRDFGPLAYSSAQYQRDCFWHGELPFWNPLNNCGIPFLAQWGLTLYPLSLFYLLLPLSWSLGIFCLGHVFLAGLGMYFLVRRWTASHFAGAFAGVALAFNGMTINDLQWPGYCVALGWLPWVVLLAERAWLQGGRTVLSAVGVGTLQMLTGAPELILLTWLLILALHVRQQCSGGISRMRAAVRFITMVALICGLTAIQLLPFLDFLMHSQRNPGFGQTMAWSMPGWGWANLLVPLFFNFQWIHGVHYQYDQYLTSSYYSGIGVMALAIAAVCLFRQTKVLLFGTICVVCLALSLGKHGCLYSWLLQIFPVLGFMRYPIKFVLMPAFLLPLLAAFGLAGVLAAQRDEKPGLWRRLAGLWVSVTGLILLILWFAWRYPQYDYPYNRWTETLVSGLSRLGFLALTGWLLWWTARTAPVYRQRWLQLFFLLVVWLDLLTSVPRQNPTVPRWVYKPGLLQFSPQPKVGSTRAMTRPTAEQFLHEFMPTNEIEDVLFRRRGLYSDYNLIDGVPKVTGIFPMNLRETDRFDSMLYASTSQEYSPVEAFLSVSHINTVSNVLAWETHTNYLPLVTSGQRPAYTTDDDALRAIFAADFDARRVVYLPLEAKAKISVAEFSSTKLEVHRFTAQRIECETESGRPAMVVVAQSYYHRWHAYVDGNRVPLWRANYAFQALEVPAGRHEVGLIYEDLAFRAGAVISAITLGACFFVCGAVAGGQFVQRRDLKSNQPINAV